MTIHSIFQMAKEIQTSLKTTQRKIRFTRSNGYDELMELVGDPALIPSDHGGTGPSKAERLEEFVNEVADFLEDYPKAPDTEPFNGMANDPDEDWETFVPETNASEGAPQSLETRKAESVRTSKRRRRCCACR